MLVVTTRDCGVELFETCVMTVNIGWEGGTDSRGAVGCVQGIGRVVGGEGFGGGGGEVADLVRRCCCCCCCDGGVEKGICMRRAMPVGIVLVGVVSLGCAVEVVEEVVDVVGVLLRLHWSSIGPVKVMTETGLVSAVVMLAFNCLVFCLTFMMPPPHLLLLGVR